MKGAAAVFVKITPAVWVKNTPYWSANQICSFTNEVEKVWLQVLHKFPGLCSKPPPGAEGMFTHSQANAYMNNTPFPCPTHAHAVWPPLKERHLPPQGSWPAGGQGVGVKTVSSANQYGIFIRQQCMMGPQSPWWVGFIHLFDLWPCTLSMGWN